MSKKVTFSIIIPCFNGWKYFDKCLNSLENQTVLPDQVIIVDDCSADESYNSLKNYANKSKLNIVVIKNEKNSGPAISRKNGIEHATSSYVLFCDCDDWYELDTIEKLRSKIEETNSDLIIFDNYKVIGERKEKANVTSHFLNSSKKEIMALYPMSLWRFGASYSLVKDVYFPPLYNGEDGAVAPQIIERANKILAIDNAFYNYYYRENSASMKPSPKAYLGMINAFEVAKKYVTTEYKQEIEFIGIKFVCIAATLSAFKAGIKNEIIKEFMKEYQSEYPSWLENNYVKSLAKSRRIYLHFLKNNFYLGCRLIAKVHTILNKG